MRLADFKLLSFDCYGTLIDWETGIWQALQPLIAANKLSLQREHALTDFAAIEPEQEHETPDLLYREILVRVHARLANLWKARSNVQLDQAFGASIGNWPAFPDTPEALTYLKRHFKLVILSNVDRQSFTATNKRLGVVFDAVCTAQDIGTYKPNPKNFEYLIDQARALGHAKSDILHTAQSLFHDHAPAERIGLARCWINRRGDRSIGSGATKPVEHMPTLDFQFPSLGAMVEAHRATNKRI